MHNMEDLYPDIRACANIGLLFFGLENKALAIEIKKIHEVIHAAGINENFYPSFVKGIIRILGRILVVTRLKEIICNKGTGRGENNRIVAIEVVGTYVGFAVDPYCELIPIKDVKPPVNNYRIAKEYVQGIINRGQRHLFFLDLERVFGAERLLISLSANAAAAIQ
jgi:purine-binding chemotaxis protein CheW